MEKIVKIYIRTFMQVVAMFFIRILNTIFSKPYLAAISLIIFCLTGYIYGLVAGLMWLVFLLFQFYGWDARLAGAAGMVGLILCPILYFFRRYGLSEQFALYAFYLFMIMIMLQFLDYLTIKFKS